MINLYFVLYNFHISNYCKSLVDNFDNFEGFLVLIIFKNQYELILKRRDIGPTLDIMSSPPVSMGHKH